ncbi:MAG: hypothetical protein AABX70_00930 [Nanoarchaeota archaeon]
MRTYREIEQLANPHGFVLGRYSGEQPQYVFIADSQHSICRTIAPLLVALAQPDEAIHLEGLHGTVERKAEGIGIVNGKRTKLEPNQSLRLFSDNPSALETLLDRGVQIQGHDDLELLRQQELVYQDLLAEHAVRLFSQPNNYDNTFAQFMDLSRRRSAVMIPPLLSASNTVHYSLIGEKHLDSDWYDAFQGKNFTTLTRAPSPK